MTELQTKKWLTVEGAADYLGLKKSTIYAYIHERKLPYYKRGHIVRFKVEELDEWMEASRVESLQEHIQNQLHKGVGNGNAD